MPRKKNILQRAGNVIKDVYKRIIPAAVVGAVTVGTLVFGPMYDSTALAAEVIKDSTPVADGFHMPGEYERHHGTFLIWPTRAATWTNEGRDVQPIYVQMIKEISEVEELYLLVDEEHKAQAMDMLKELPQDHIHYLNIPTDDAWVRDTGPSNVVDGNGVRRGVCWRFNSWGGDYNGLYSNYEKDAAANYLMTDALQDDSYDAGSFVLEGGSILVDGDGTAVVTESCLLSKGRNPNMTKEQIEQKLKDYLGVQKVIWLPYGIFNDETDGHVDNVVSFVRPGEILLAWTDNEKDPQYAMSAADLKVLETEKDAKGRSLIVHKLPLPKKPVLFTKEEVESIDVPEEQMHTRQIDERLAASYANFYICNGKIILPQFGDENDAVAVKILSECFPDRKIVPLPAHPIILGGGNFHCLSQQIPETGK